MQVVGLFILPILIWLGIAANIRLLRQRSRATVIQSTLFVVLPLVLLATYVALAANTRNNMPLLLLAFVESLAIMLLIYFQLKQKTGQPTILPDERN